jgi:hypothetical protein
MSNTLDIIHRLSSYLKGRFGEWNLCPETGTSPIYWDQTRERRHIPFSETTYQMKIWATDNIQEIITVLIYLRHKILDYHAILLQFEL